MDSAGTVKDGYLIPFPRLTNGIPRPETVVLFGCWLAETRIAAELTTDEFAARAHRSNEWVASVEAGQCIPSPTGMEDLRLAMRGREFDAARLPAGKAELNPLEFARRLELDPHGGEARRLRKEFDIRSSDRPESLILNDGGSILGIIDQLQHRDRLMALTPILGIALIAGVLLAGKPWANGAEFQWPDFDGVAFVGLAAVALASIFLASIGAWIDIALSACRRGTARKMMQNAKEIREDEQTQVEPQRGWYWPGEDPFLVPSRRDRVRSLTIETDLAERLQALLFLFSLAALLPSLIAIRGDATLSSHWRWLACGGVATALLVPTSLRLRTLRRASRDALNFGYGVRFEPTGLRLSWLARTAKKLRWVREVSSFPLV